MLKREITYEDFNGDKVTETFYFNLSKTELIELEVGYGEGLEAAIRKIIKAEDRQALITEFKKIILMTYGEKSPDGKRFAKSDELRMAFSQTAAFDALFMELATSDNAAVDFLKGVLPSELQEGLDKSMLPPPNIQPAENIER